MPTRFDCEDKPNEFMEMPCRCDCGKWFDLHDGYVSKWRNTTICRECKDEETDCNTEQFLRQNDL